MIIIIFRHASIQLWFSVFIEARMCSQVIDTDYHADTRVAKLQIYLQVPLLLVLEEGS